MSNDLETDATIMALRATVNALVKHLRETDPGAVEKVREQAQKEARAITPDGMPLQIRSVNKITSELFSHED